ncbi:MAG: ketopantoate reductase family protein [Lachnospiraceae bacterium]|nr:ketopantoate reductase family protein [Lachnospiraceae bacterium]
MRVLIYGAGVIGSLYAALLSEAGVDITVFTRGKRLRDLQTKGLLYNRNGRIKTAKVTVLSSLDDHDRYDCIFLTVREDQLMTALAELKDNSSPTIVTMVNSLDPYEQWEAVCGSGRILPAFPGAGGSLEGGVLDADLTPRIIQPTTIGRTDRREKELTALFRRAHIPYQIVSDMHEWQICHLGMVVPIADAYYEADDPRRAGENPFLMKKTACRIQENFRRIKGKGVKLSPVKMNVFLILPSSIVAVIMGFVFRSDFGNRFMYQHSMKAPEEMRRLHEQLYAFLGS